jgi:hydroxymethylpyrimidine/phosphomethylpyrimidine kinase
VTADGVTGTFTTTVNLAQPANPVIVDPALCPMSGGAGSIVGQMRAYQASLMSQRGSLESQIAGIEADLPVFAVLGVHGRTAITALTVQRYSPLPKGEGRSEGEVHATPAHILAALLDSHTCGTLPDAIKIGMIGTRANLEVICDFLKRHPRIPVVLDTVLRATSGLELLEAAAIPLLRSDVLPRATVVTPNLQEASILAEMTVDSVATMERVARKLHQGTQVMLVKGGHLLDDPVDVAFDGHAIHHFKGPRITTPHTRGTGCTLASAIAVAIAKGATPLDAISQGRQFVREWLSKNG